MNLETQPSGRPILTSVIHSDATGDGPEVALAAEVLDRGGLVAFPTDTVYGLAAAWRLPQALARLAQVKGRAAGKPFALLLAQPDEAERYAQVPPAARRLIARYWPGPLTLVLPREGKEPIGLRLPDHPLPRAIVRAARYGVAATSANLAGGRDALTAQEVLATFSGRVELVIDAGTAYAGQASSVVQVTSAGWLLLREGAIPQREIVELLGPPLDGEPS